MFKKAQTQNNADILLELQQKFDNVLQSVNLAIKNEDVKQLKMLVPRLTYLTNYIKQVADKQQANTTSDTATSNTTASDTLTRNVLDQQVASLMIIFEQASSLLQTITLAVDSVEQSNFSAYKTKMLQEYNAFVKSLHES